MITCCTKKLSIAGYYLLIYAVTLVGIFQLDISLLIRKTFIFIFPAIMTDSHLDESYSISSESLYRHSFVFKDGDL